LRKPRVALVAPFAYQHLSREVDAMHIDWQVTPDDVARVNALIHNQRENGLVRDRERNLAETKPSVSEDRFWRAMVCMRLTTQQKSGPAGAVARFTRTEPFPLPCDTLRRQQSLEGFIADTLKEAGLRRFIRTIPDQLGGNFRHLEQGGWTATLEHCNRLTRQVQQETEAEVADYIDDTFKGFGPKQSRNLLQALALTRYEIPIDSRMTKWLNENGFPFRVSASALADRDYYRLVSAGIQCLCKNAGVFPCMLDAAIFASRTGEDWSSPGIAF
jgi:hypothetical protein